MEIRIVHYQRDHMGRDWFKAQRYWRWFIFQGWTDVFHTESQTANEALEKAISRLKPYAADTYHTV